MCVWFYFNVRDELGFFHSRFLLPDKLKFENVGCDLTIFFIWIGFFSFPDETGRGRGCHIGRFGHKRFDQ